MTDIATLPPCDRMAGCTGGAVTHIDTAGFVYCTPCGQRRVMSEPCRKLRPHELRRLERGQPIERY